MTASLPSIVLARHGATAWSVTGQHTGRTDLALTPDGERDAAALRTKLADRRFALVLSSPLQRARRTAELAGFGDGLQLDPDLLEWDYGEYEGRRTADIRKERPGWNLFTDGCPGGETLASVALRADRVIARLQAADADALVFAHGHILRVLAARWLRLPALEARRFVLATATLSVLGYDHDRDEPALRIWNAERA